MKKLIYTTFTVLSVAFSFYAHSKERVYSQYSDNTFVDLSRIYIPVNKSIKAINTTTGIEEYLKMPTDYKVSVKGEVNGMYEIEVIKEGRLEPDIYLTSPRNIEDGINWYSVKGIIEGMGAVRAGAILKTICNVGSPSVETGNASPSHQAVSNYSTVRNTQTEIYIEPTEGEYHEGCEALAEQPIPDSNKGMLATCMESIKKAITQGNRDQYGNLDRNKVFASMYERLKPEEQIFAAYIFTGHGEAAMWTSVEEPGEAMLVMKSVQNRRITAEQQREDKNLPIGAENFNELDIVLTEWQYSMYNNGENWDQYMDPGISVDFAPMIEAYAQMTDPATEWDPEEAMNNVTHYHREYVNPVDNWAARGVRVYPSVNGQRLRSDSSSGGYNKIYYNVDGSSNWGYVESRETHRPD